MFVTALLISACTGAPGASPSLAPSASPSPPPGTAPGTPTPEASPRHGVQGLVADLLDAGATAEVSGSFDGQPLAFEGLVVCVNGKDVRVYSYGTQEEAVAVAARIDPRDPSNMGTSIVEWDGWPQFWQRDRILVLYLGNDQATRDTLKQLLGEPFAVGQPQPQRLPGTC